MNIDLHVHSEYAPNGKWPLRKIFELAKAKDLSYLAITDSYCIDGLQEAFELGEEFGIKLIKGVEMQSNSRVHILAYNFDENNENFLRALKESREWADSGKIEGMAQKLRENYNLDISLEEICNLQNTISPSTKQFCQALVMKGYAKDWGEAKDLFFSPNSKNGNCYVGVKYSPEYLVKKAKEAGAIVILAHPHQIEIKEVEINNLMPKLIESGLDGIEIHYNNQSFDENKKQKAFNLLQDFELKIISGGSDFNGQNVTCLGGNPKITTEMISEELLFGGK